MFRTIILTFAMILALCSNAYCKAPQFIGYITASFGDNSIAHKGVLKKALSGMKIHEGDILLTRTKGKLQFKLKDNTLVSLGHDSKITIVAYNYQPNDENSNIVLHSEIGIFRITSGDIATLDEEGFVIKTINTKIVANDDKIRLNIESKKDYSEAIACIQGSIDIENAQGDSSNIQEGEFLNANPSEFLGDSSDYDERTMPGTKDYEIGKKLTTAKKQTDINREAQISKVEVENRFDDNLELYFRNKSPEELLPAKKTNYDLVDGWYVLDDYNNEDILKLKYKVEKGKISDYQFGSIGDLYDKSNFQAKTGVGTTVVFQGRIVGEYQSSTQESDDILGAFKFNIDVKDMQILADSYYGFLVQHKQVYWRAQIVSGKDFSGVTATADKLASEVDTIKLNKKDIHVYTKKGETAPKGVGGSLILEDGDGNKASTNFGGYAGLSVTPNFNSVEASKY